MENIRTAKVEVNPPSPLICVGNTPQIDTDDYTTDQSDRIHSLILHFDAVRDVCVFNASFQRVLLLTDNTLTDASQNIFSYLHPEDTENFRNEILGHVTSCELPADRVYRFVRADDVELWLRISRMTIETSENQIRSVTVVFANDSDRRMKELTRDSILDGAATVSFVADVTKDEIIFSENLREILPDAQLTYGGHIMETVAQYVFEEDLRNVLEPISEVIAGDKERYACEFRIRRGNEYVWIALRGKICTDPVSKHQILVGSLMNLDDMRNYKKFAEEYINRHKVTLLPGRTTLIDATEKVLCDRNVFSAAVILADILSFQKLNDRFGREAGNHVLKAFARHLHAALPSGAELYHMSGDTFAILWPHASRMQVDRFMQYTIEAGTVPVDVGTDSVDISFVMSGALYPSCGSRAAELVENAEITLHKIKKTRKQPYALYSSEDKLEITEQLDFELQITRSLRNTNENFLLYFQPLFSPGDGRLLGAEALLRWIAPNREIMTPQKVIEGLMSTGNIRLVSAFVLDLGIARCREWIDAGVGDDFQMHINITADDLMHAGFADEVLLLLDRYNLHAKNLMLEITETSLMKNLAVCRSNIVRLRAKGVRFSLDDFGSGYSSLNCLRELPVDEVKIDRVFLENVQKDRYNHSFVSAIVILAHSISAKVCIEGVESKEQADAVRKLKPDLFQGFFFGHPLPPKLFEERFIAS